MSLTNEQKRLVEENIPLVYKFCNDYEIYNMDKEDYAQSLIETVCEVIPKYNKERGKLSTFLYNCIRNEYKTIIKSLNRKHNTLPEGYAFLYLDGTDYQSEINLADIIEDTSEDGYDIMVRYIKEEISKKYGKSYAEIFEMRAMGDTLSEISERFGITKQGVSARLNKMKPFIKNQLLKN